MKKRSKKFDCVANMPYLRHSVPGQPFDWSASEVGDWLCQQPALRQYLFDRCVVGGLIVFDKVTGMWRGKNTKGELDL